MSDREAHLEILIAAARLYPDISAEQIISLMNSNYETNYAEQ